MRRSKLKFIVINSIILAIIILGLIVFFKTDFFRTKRSAFFRYFNQIPTALEVLKTDKFDSYNDKKQDSPYVRNADISIQTSSNIADSAILDSIKFKVNQKMDQQNEHESIDFVVNKNNEQLIKISAIQNKDSYGILSEDVTNGFVTVKNSDLKRVAKDWGASTTQLIPDTFRNIKIKTILQTSKNEKNHIDDCVKLIKNNVPDTAYSKEGKKKIKINNKSYITNSYKLSLNANDSANLQCDILEKISKDSILMDYFASKAKLLNLDEEYTTINSLNNLIKKRVNDLKSNPQLAGKLEITVYENKQKNVRTEIKSGENTILIEHVDEGDDEYSSLTFNKDRYSIEYDGNKYYFEHENTSEENFTKKIRIEYSQSGSVENNDIKNNLVITKNEGAKSITYAYSDTVNFTNDIGKIDDFGTNKIIVLNDYSDDDLKSFFELLRKRINDVYVKKGSLIGINLDPIFE